MDVFEAIINRRSIRVFKSDPIPEEMLSHILEAARWAPSAGNCQARAIIVVDDALVKKQLSQAASAQSLVKEAPIDLVVCADEQRSALRYGKRGRKLYCLLDAAASVQNILLATHALGLGACWIGAFHDRMVAEVLHLSNGVRPVAIIPIGYPAEKPLKSSRVSLKDLLHINCYRTKREMNR